jgi:hypothetical protein
VKNSDFRKIKSYFIVLSKLSIPHPGGIFIMASCDFSPFFGIKIMPFTIDSLKKILFFNLDLTERLDQNRVNLETVCTPL